MVTLAVVSTISKGFLNNWYSIIGVSRDQINHEEDNLMKRTKLCVEDVCGLAEICLCKCFFLWSDEMRILKNFGLVGLSVMVVLSES